MMEFLAEMLKSKWKHECLKGERTGYDLSMRGYDLV